MAHVPVNVAHVVAGHVFAKFLEVHAAALEMTEVGADHHVVDDAVGAHFDATHAFEQFSRSHFKSKVQSPKSKVIRSSEFRSTEVGALEVGHETCDETADLSGLAA